MEWLKSKVPERRIIENSLSERGTRRGGKECNWIESHFSIWLSLCPFCHAPLESLTCARVPAAPRAGRRSRNGRNGAAKKFIVIYLSGDWLALRMCARISAQASEVKRIKIANVIAALWSAARCEWAFFSFSIDRNHKILIVSVFLGSRGFFRSRTDLCFSLNTIFCICIRPAAFISRRALARGESKKAIQRRNAEEKIYLPERRVFAQMCLRTRVQYLEVAGWGLDSVQ